MSGSKPVFMCSENAVQQIWVALKLQDHIHHVFQNLRTGNAAFFIDMANEQYRRTGFFRVTNKACGALADLGHRTRRALHVRNMQGLDGIHDDQMRPNVL